MVSDEYYKNNDTISVEKLILKSKIIIIGAPHKKYLKLKILKKNKNVINIWGTEYN